MSIDTRISLQKLEIFEDVVELGGITRAAHRLHVAQPVVTAHIRSLEERLGTKLFDRSGRMLELTEAGEACHAWAVYVLRRAREMIRTLDALADGSGGSVAVAANMTLGSYQLPPILAAFQRERPNVELQLTVADFEKVLIAVESGDVDFAVVTLEIDPSTSQMKAEMVGEDRMVLVTSGRGKPSPTTMPLKTILELPFIEIWHNTPFDRRLRNLGLAARQIAISLGHPEAAKRAVRDGSGVAVLLYSSVAEEIASGALREIRIDDIDDANLKLPIFVVSRRDKTFGKVQADLIGTVRSHLSSGGSPRTRVKIRAA